MTLLLLRTLIILFLFSTMYMFAAPPDWVVNPSAFQYNGTITAVLTVNDSEAHDGNLVGAFVGDEIRGVSAPIQVGNRWLYFMTVYSNVATNEALTFKVYLGDADAVLPIEDTIPFTANAVTGSPADPFLWHAFLNYDYAPVVGDIPDQTIEIGGVFSQFNVNDYLTSYDADTIEWNIQGYSRLVVTLSPTGAVTVTAPTGYTGSETVIFTATDRTNHGYSDSDTAVFTVLPPDLPPDVTDIPNQTIGLDGRFNPADLDSYLTNPDGGNIEWSYRFLTVDRGTPIPDWSVNPSSYQFSMNMTVRVLSRGINIQGTGSMLAAFSGDELRGVTQGFTQ